MKIGFPEDRIIKEYNAEFKEVFWFDENPKMNFMDDLTFDIEYERNKINLYVFPNKPEETNEYIDILEGVNQTFTNVEYELNTNGTPRSILNLHEIRDKRSYIRKTAKYNINDNMITDLILGLSGIMEDDNALFELLKRYCIIPYLYTGFHNKEISDRDQYRVNGMIYNVFPMSDIPVVYTLSSEEMENGDKKILISGKEDPNFDRYNYMDEVKDRLNRELEKLNRSFSMTIESYYIFSSDATLKEMKLVTKIMITQLLDYRCKYFMSEKNVENTSEDINLYNMNEGGLDD